MNALTVFFACAAFFLSGLCFGLLPKKTDTSKLKQASKTEKNISVRMPDEEYRNFLSYDGTKQA